MSSRDYAHRCVFKLSLFGARDSRAPGGAVTVALCGHWDHEGACRWPHLSTIEEGDDGTYRLTVEFDVPDNKIDEVKEKIRLGLETGGLVGPDGRRTTWQIEE